MPSAFPPDHREKSISRLKIEIQDILIVGGGINGAGILRDLQLRAQDAGEPLRAALIDKAHFASGTSGRNSQLIHGGLRYLKYFEFDLVREALRERATLLKVAPHLVEPLPMILPFYGGWIGGLWNRLFYGTGLRIYDRLAGELNIAQRQYLSRQEVGQLEPKLSQRGLFSAAIFYDCRIHSARLLLENLFEAAELGAPVANYIRAHGWERKGALFHVKAEDMLTGAEFNIRTKRLVDARGPWDTEGKVRLVRGSHIIVPRLNASENAIAYFGKDGRIIFVIPWGPEKSLSLVGTTDVDHTGSADEVRISEEEVRYLRAAVRRLFPEAGDPAPLAAYSSLRPLVAEERKSATAASRSHKIWLDGDVLKITGGKYTTYRAMSEEAVDLLKPEWKGRCRTAEAPLGGTGRHVLTTVDRRVVDWAIKREMVRRLSDLVFVSTYWGHERLLTEEVLRPVAELMAKRLPWSQSQIEEEIAATLDLARMPG